MTSSFFGRVQTFALNNAPKYRPGILQRILPLTYVEKDVYDVNIIYVPELRSSTHASNTSALTRLKDLVAASDLRCRIYEFDYSWQDSRVPIWHSVIQRSNELSDALKRHEPLSELYDSRMVLVGHGLGGTIIKHFISTIHERYYDLTLKWLHSIQHGIIFLGTPHPTRAHREHWLRLTLILRACLGVSGSLLVQAEQECATVANLSEKFEESTLASGISLISAYELKKTHIGDRFYKNKKQLLVDESLARIRIKHEILIPVDADHHGICSVVQGSELAKRIASLLKEISGRPLRPLDQVSVQTAGDMAKGFNWASTASDHDISPAAATGGTGTSHAEELIGADYVDIQPPVKLPCYMLKAHSRNTQFVGRTKILGQLSDVLLPRPTNEDIQAREIAYCVLCGLGGIGKTQIALEFAYNWKEKYDAVFWVAADTVAKIDEAFSNIAVEMQLLSSTTAKDRVVSRNAVLGWLCNPRKDTSDPGTDLDDAPDLANWLLIFDNADDFATLQDYMPVDSYGSILFTSRNTSMKHILPSSISLDLEPLEDEEADQLLQRMTYKAQTESDRENSLRLVRRIGGLPIAITHLAGIINGKDLTFAECLKAYDSEQLLKGVQGLTLRYQSGYEYSLLTVWALESLSAPALCLLQVLSVLDPDVAHESILQHYEEARHVLDSYPSAVMYLETRAEIIQSSLIRRNKHQLSLTIHRVVQDVVRSHMSEERSALIFSLAVELLSQTWVEDREWAFGFRTSEWQQADITVPHIASLSKIYDMHRPVQKMEIVTKFVSLLSRASTHLLERSNYDDCLTLGRMALDIARTHQDDMLEIYADTLMNMYDANAIFGQCKIALHFAEMHFDARIRAERALGRTPDSEFSFEGMAYTALAYGLILNERFEEAIPLCLTGREVHCRAPGFHNDVYWPHWAYAYHAWALIGLRRPDDALPVIMETLQWRERHYGPDDTESMKTANALQILGVIYEQQGRQDDAFDAFSRSLPLYSKTEGDSALRINQVRVKLGEHYSRLQRPEAARMMFDDALKYFGASSYHQPETARTLYLKSEFLQQFDSTEEAEELRRRAIASYIKLRKGSTKALQQIGREDFDRLVMITSR